MITFVIPSEVENPVAKPWVISTKSCVSALLGSG
jgi:hypothetical protein